LLIVFSYSDELWLRWVESGGFTDVLQELEGEVPKYFLRA
jgi:hypothetical protein